VIDFDVVVALDIHRNSPLSHAHDCPGPLCIPRAQMVEDLPTKETLQIMDHPSIRDGHDPNLNSVVHPDCLVAHHDEDN